ncbi:FkbM family methyltransferase [Pedobacter soli]|uniref:Methyltransferase, FkbM family n=1 Tax=Pedobacter soli TaxID=390242 RepID=A0A1G6X2X9_9SPHI|nr:FkbM family methyltransferase [Pedobacter soli]SDD72458.1 methyltransferase, FkbM family [Pedobacter soli]
MKNLLRKLLNTLEPNNRYKRISYAQYGEDLIIKSIFREYLGIERPSYLDIGAHHPYHLSNTALFYKFGCRGINIEANPDLIAAFKKFRPQDQNLNIGISASNSENLDFYIMEQLELNTFVKKQAEELAAKGYPVKKVIGINCQSLSSIIQTYCNGIFPDLLSLDVEGLDESVLESYNFETTKPKIICVENLHTDESGFLRKNDQIRAILKRNGYFLIADTFLNDIFMDSALLKYR